MALIVSYKSYINLTKFLNKFSFRKIIIFFLGFLAPIPIFIDFQNLSLILIKFNPQIAYSGIEGDIPIPIGFIANAFFILLLIQKTNNLSKFIKIILLFIFIFAFVYYKFGILRILAILSPFIFLISFRKIILNPCKDILRYIYGYLTGISIFFTTNIISFVSFSIYNFYELEDSIESEIIRNINIINLNYARQIFNIEIYQYYISVSAVISLIVGIVIFLKINNNYKNKFLNILLTYIAISSLLISSFSLRKTSLIGLSFLIFLILVNKLLNKKVFISFWIILTTSFASLNYFLISNTRISSINIAQMFSERPFLKYLKIIFNERSFTDILFGSTPGFGGFSNIILELIYRSGLLGLLLYSLILVILLRKIYLLFHEKTHLKLIIVFLFSNLLIGNLFNLNLTQPYYVCNLFSALLLSYTFSNREFIEIEENF